MADMTIDEIMALGEAHTKAMAPKPKAKKKKKMMKPAQTEPVGLAASTITGRNNRIQNAYDGFMGGKSKIKR